MAPAVPFALLGAVQLTAVAVWLGIAGAVCFPRLRRRTTPLIVTGSLLMAVADALTALRLSSATSNPIGELRLLAFALLALGFVAGALRLRSTSSLPAIVAPLGVSPSIAIAGGAIGVVAAVAAWRRGRGAASQRWSSAWIGLGLLLTAAAAGLSGQARSSTDGALAVLSLRGAASVALAVALVLLARDNLLGKLLGSIVAGVVAMAVGAVAVVGIGVASQAQHEQSQRLLTVAKAQQRALRTIATRAGVYAQIVALCPGDRSRCVASLKLFSVDPEYFALIDRPGKGARTVAPRADALDPTALTQLAGSKVVAGALRRSASPAVIASGPVLLHGSPSTLVVVAAVPGRPGGGTDAQVKPTFAAVYGIALDDRYLKSVAQQTGYDVSVIDNGRVLASSLSASASPDVTAAAARSDLASAGPTESSVLPAQGQSPTVAFVPVGQSDSDDVRIATLAISQPASVALAAQRSVLRRLVLTALAVLLLVAIAAFLLARRIVEPVGRLTTAARQVSHGDLDAHVQVAGFDEIGVLSRAFSAMTSSLRGLTSDLRASVATESALRGRLETVVGSMTDGLVTTDGDGAVTAANPMAQRLLGLAEPELVGRLAEDVIVIADVGSGSLDLAEGAGFDAVLARPGLAALPVRISVAPLADDVGHVIVLSDRTREREIERMKTEFLSNVSHELRTPLTPIRGYAEMLARRPDLPPDQTQKFIAEILAGTARMSRAVDLLVDVAALEAGRVRPLRQPVPLGGFADARLADWKERYPDRAGDLRRRLAPDLPAVDIDQAWLSKALDELVDNAVKYTEAGTPVTLVAAMVGDTVRLAVRDAGPGIDTARLPELLGDFSQADASETRRVGGFGLGLGFVSRVAQQLGLTLRVAAPAGKGSEFSFDLPVATRR